ncbi:MAG: hypothetical protein Q7U97_14205 [Rhodocyclaceae bacterium]|nr:hypothetical protein [Rhodocyclaceae bacterium]
MSYADTIAKARRLAILLALYFSPGYTLPRAALRDQVSATGYVMSGDLAATEIAWLTEQGLVDTLQLDAVRLTARGEDIALGRSQNPGVRRPSPGEVT